MNSSHEENLYKKRGRIGPKQQVNSERKYTNKYTSNLKLKQSSVSAGMRQWEQETLSMGQLEDNENPI